MPELFNRASVVATVKTVDRLIDAASNTFRVRLELPNPNGALPAGLRCKVDLALKLPEVERTAATVAGFAKTSAVAAAPSLAPAPAPAAKPADNAAAAVKQPQDPKSVTTEPASKLPLFELWRAAWQNVWASVWGSASVRAVAPSAHALTLKRPTRLLQRSWMN